MALNIYTAFLTQCKDDTQKPLSTSHLHVPPQKNHLSIRPYAAQPTAQASNTTALNASLAVSYSFSYKHFREGSRGEIRMF